MFLSKAELRNRIQEEIINKSKTVGENATLSLTDGSKYSFTYGSNRYDIPKKLLQANSNFYYKLVSEIYDELHPY